MISYQQAHFHAECQMYKTRLERKQTEGQLNILHD